jgi:hypothetical protein
LENSDITGLFKGWMPARIHHHQKELDLPNFQEKMCCINLGYAKFAFGEAILDTKMPK